MSKPRDPDDEVERDLKARGFQVVRRSLYIDLAIEAGVEIGYTNIEGARWGWANVAEGGRVLWVPRWLHVLELACDRADRSETPMMLLPDLCALAHPDKHAQVEVVMRLSKLGEVGRAVFELLVREGPPP